LLHCFTLYSCRYVFLSCRHFVAPACPSAALAATSGQIFTDSNALRGRRHSGGLEAENCDPRLRRARAQTEDEDTEASSTGAKTTTATATVAPTTSEETAAEETEAEAEAEDAEMEGGT